MLNGPEQGAFDAPQTPPAPEPLPLETGRRAPVPLPVPVTGVASRNWRGLVVAALVMVALLACGGLALVAAPVLDTLRHGEPLDRALVERARVDYPGYVVTDVRAGARVADGVAYVDRRLTLRNEARPGFTIVAIYSAPSATASEAAGFSNRDGFFTLHVASLQPVDSFIEMWLRDHAGQVCTYVQDTGMDSKGVRHFDVGYEDADSDGLFGASDGAFQYDFDPHSGVWSVSMPPSLVEQQAAEAEASAAPLPEPPAIDTSSTYPRGPALNDFQGSDAPVEEQVAELLPSYVYEGPVTTGFEPDKTYALVRHAKYRGFRVAIPVNSLRFNDPVDDTLQVPEADGPKSRAFVRMWAKTHPGSVIWFLMTDPDFDDDTDLMEVTYFATLDAFRSETGAFRVYRYRYDRKSREWAIERG